MKFRVKADPVPPPRRPQKTASDAPGRLEGPVRPLPARRPVVRVRTPDSGGVRRGFVPLRFPSTPLDAVFGTEPLMLRGSAGWFRS